MKKSENYYYGIWLAVLSGVSYSTVGYFGVTITETGLSLYNMLFWRYFLSSILITGILCVKQKDIFAEPKQTLKVFLSGIIVYGPGAVLYFIASQYLGTGMAMVIFFTYPAMIMIYNVIFNNKHISLVKSMALVLMFSGMLFFVDCSEFYSDLFGIVTALGSAFSFGCFVVFSSTTTVPSMESTMALLAGAATTSMVSALIDGSFVLPVLYSSWVNIISVSVFGTILPIVCLYQSLKYICEEEVAMLSVLEPLFMIIIGVVLLGETLTVSHCIGAGIMIISVVIIMLPKNLNGMFNNSRSLQLKYESK